MAQYLWGLFGILLIVGPATTQAQTRASSPHASLSGVILDQTTQDTLPGVHIFLVGSSHGTTSDTNGQFFLDRIPLGKQEIGLSMIGYKTAIQQVNFVDTIQTTIQVDLTPEVYELGKVLVSEKRNRRWRKRFNRFRRYFIGESENADETAILNPEVLSFRERLGVLIASAGQDLIIENRALGYRIYYTLFDFLLQDGQPRYRGVARYEPLDSQNEEEAEAWEIKRTQAFNGSLPHFLRVLFSATTMEQINQQGFYLSALKHLADAGSNRRNRPSHLKLPGIIAPTPKSFEKELLFEQYLKIEYTQESESERYLEHFGPRKEQRSNQHSYLKLNEPVVLLNQQGFIYDAYSMIIYGYMAHERMGDALPLDYEPTLRPGTER